MFQNNQEIYGSHESESSAFLPFFSGAPSTLSKNPHFTFVPEKKIGIVTKPVFFPYLAGFSLLL